jgi:death-on-curing protein
MPGSGLHLSREVHNPSGLASAVARPKQMLQGKPLYRGLPRKGAALFHSLIANHPFTDGNKRTAVMALDQFLIANNRILLMSPDELVELALLVADRRGASHDALLDELTKRIAERSKPFSWVSDKPEFQIILREYQAIARSARKLLDAPRGWLQVAHAEMINEITGENYDFWEVWSERIE